MDLRSIHDQKTKSNLLLFFEGRMLLSKPLKPLMKGSMAHRLPGNLLPLLHGSTIRDVDGQTLWALRWLPPKYGHRKGWKALQLGEQR